MGATPLDVARIFGPHPEVESLLSAAMLEDNFASKYVVRRGSRIAISVADTGADEAGGGEGAEAAASAVAEEGCDGAETDDDASTGQSAEARSLVIESLEDEGSDQRPARTIIGSDAHALPPLRSKSRGGVRDEDTDEAEGDGMITINGLSAIERQQEAMRGEQAAMRREQEAMRIGMQGELDEVQGKLDAVHGKLDEVLERMAATGQQGRH